MVDVRVNRGLPFDSWGAAVRAREVDTTVVAREGELPAAYLRTVSEIGLGIQSALLIKLF